MFTKELEVQEPQLSEGEKYIEEYFIEENIKYIPQYKLFLKADQKAFRVVDFYLPKYGVYVEFFGKWNVSQEEKDRYREKKNVYYKNSIPCIYLYPENLGNIEYVFHYRIREVLRQHKMDKELSRYLYHDFNQQHGSILVVLAAFTFVVAVYFSFKQSFTDFLITAWIVSTITLGGYYIYSLIQFLKDRKEVK